MHELSRGDARRIAVRAQLLDSSRPVGLLNVVRRLTLLQIDPVAAVTPSAHLVAWSRLGSSYAPADLDAALQDRTLLEPLALIRPAEDLALYRADMARRDQAERGELSGWRAAYRDRVHANDACRRDILDRLGWGYYALPVLYHDRLVGKLDALADRQAGVLRVHAIHQDVPFTKPMTAAVGREVEDLAAWLPLHLAMP